MLGALGKKIGLDIGNSAFQSRTFVKSLALAVEQACSIEGIRSVLSVMLSPSDADLRRQLAAYFEAIDIVQETETRHSIDRKVAVPAWILRELTQDSPGQNIQAKIDLAHRQGSAAGDTLNLYFAFSMAAKKCRQNFLNVDSLTSIKDNVAQNHSKSLKWVEQIWGQFKPVAHLWAAAQIETALSGSRIFPYGPQTCQRFFAVAARFEEFAINAPLASQVSDNTLIPREKIISVSGIFQSSINADELISAGWLNAGLQEKIASIFKLEPIVSASPQNL